MAVKSNPAREAELDRKWNDIREDMLADYYLVAYFATGKERRCELSTDPDTGRTTSFELYRGIPAVTIRDKALEDGSRPVLYVVGDSMGSGDPKVRAVLDDPARQLAPALKYRILDKVLTEWDDVAQRVENVMSGVSSRHLPPAMLCDKLVDGFLLDEGPLDRATFFGATRYLNERAMFDIRENVTLRLNKVFFKDADYGTPELDRAREQRAIAQKDLDKTFSQWHRLAGQLDWRVECLGAARGVVKPVDIAKTAVWAMHNPDYAPYKQRSVPVWIDNTCRGQNVKRSDVIAEMTKLDPALVKRITAPVQQSVANQNKIG